MTNSHLHFLPFLFTWCSVCLYPLRHCIEILGIFLFSLSLSPSPSPPTFFLIYSNMGVSFSAGMPAIVCVCVYVCVCVCVRACASACVCERVVLFMAMSLINHFSQKMMWKLGYFCGRERVTLGGTSSLSALLPGVGYFRRFTVIYQQLI